MALFRPHLRSSPFGRERDLAIALLAAAAVAIPGQAMAQSIDIAADSVSTHRCDAPHAALPAQIAMTTLGNVEPAAGPRPGGNTDPILGGQVSRLEQMRLAQAAGTPAAPSPAPAAFAVTPAALAPTIQDDCRRFPASLPASEPASAIDVPENAILGSMSIAIERTPLDQKWSGVNVPQGSAKMARLLATTGARRNHSLAAQIEAVNSWVNRKIAFGEDRDLYGHADYWATAAETFRRGAGDCEDFAIAKMELLSVLGIERDKMRLVVARDLVRNADHAVLIVTFADRSVMLDNMTDRLLDARQANDYRPIMSFSQNNKWLHGYAVQPAAPIRMASAETVVRPAPSKPTNVWTLIAPRKSPIFSFSLLSVRSALPTWFFARV